MAEVPIAPLEEINENTDFTVKEISKAEFEAIWEGSDAGHDGLASALNARRRWSRPEQASS